MRKIYDHKVVFLPSDSAPENAEDKLEVWGKIGYKAVSCERVGGGIMWTLVREREVPRKFDSD